MLRSLEVQNFRSFRQFSMSELGRVNLLVGTNNSGKTSLLEAIEILMSSRKPEVLWNSLVRRGERQSNEYGIADVRHLFLNHEFNFDAPITLRGKNAITTSEFVASISAPIDDSVFTSPELYADIMAGQVVAPEDLAGIPQLELNWTGLPALSFSVLGNLRRSLQPVRTKEEDIPLRFVTTNFLPLGQFVSDFENIVLTAKEDIVVDALKVIEPYLDRIAPITTKSSSSRLERGSFMARVTTQKNRPFPLGSMGDGIWRMLGIALSLVNAQGGVLLVDEIDTGLHYSVMEKMWKLVYETAKRLDVQVFATTHSRDCYEALAAISNPNISENSDVSIQKIETGKTKAIFFTEQEIRVLAEDKIEVR
jgi:AAA domain, putative AbiEii toxin, Type IV TA system/AAA ATPase domain